MHFSETIFLIQAFDLEKVSFNIGECKIPSKVTFFRVRSSSLEKGIQGLKVRETFEVEIILRYYTYLRYK